MELQERIARSRKAAGLSQEELGSRLGVSRQAVSKWETGQTKPDAEALALMCRVLDVSADYLLLGVEPGQTPPPPEPPKEIRYAILLRGPVETVTPAIQDLLCPLLALDPAALTQRLQQAPSILLRDLDKETAHRVLRGLIDLNCNVSALDTRNSGSIAEALAAPRLTSRQIIAPEEVSPEPPKEPMGFGMTVLAVAVGIIVALFLLSLF